MIGAQSLRHSFPPDADLIQPNNHAAQPPMSPPAFSDHDATLRQLQLSESQRNFLKTYSARLEAELKAYQMKFPDILAPVDDANDDLAPWTVNQQYISPLIIAYDSQIAQANTANAELRQDLQNLKTEVNNLVTRNEQLEQELESHIVKLLGRFDDGSGTGGVLDSNELHELYQRCALLGDENQLLRTQELESRRELDLIRVLVDEKNEIEVSLRNEIGNYEVKVSELNNLQTQVEGLQRQLSNTRNQTEEAIKHMKSAQEVSVQLQIELQGKTKDAEQFKQLLKDHEMETEKCIHELKCELTKLHSQYTQSSGETGHLNQLLQNSLEQNRQQQQMIDAKETDLQGMLATIQNLEQSVEELENANHKLMSDTSEQKCSLLDAILQRDEAVQRAENAEKQRRLDNKQLSDALEGLRSSSSNTLSKTIAAAKAKESSLYSSIKQLQTRCADLDSGRDVADRNAKFALKNFQNLQEASVQIQNEIGDTLNEARAQIVRLENRLESAMKKDEKLENQLKIKTEQYEDERNALEERFRHMSDFLREQRSESQILSDKLNRCELALKEAKKDIRHEITMQENAQAQLQDKYNALKSSRDKEVSALHDRIQELNDIRDKIESQTGRLKRDQQAEIDAISRSHSYSVNQLQQTIRDLRCEMAAFEGKAKMLESERERLCRNVNEMKQRLETNSHQLSDFRSTVAALEQNATEQDIRIQKAHEVELHLKKEIKDLETALDKAEVAVARERRHSEAKYRKMELKMLGVSTETAIPEREEGSLKFLQ